MGEREIICTLARTWAHIHVNTHMLTHTHMHTHTHTHTITHTNMHTCSVCIQTCIHTHTHAHMHARTRVCIHTTWHDKTILNTTWCNMISHTDTHKNRAVSWCYQCVVRPVVGFLSTVHSQAGKGRLHHHAANTPWEAGRPGANPRHRDLAVPKTAGSHISWHLHVMGQCPVQRQKDARVTVLGEGWDHAHIPDAFAWWEVSCFNFFFFLVKFYACGHIYIIYTYTRQTHQYKNQTHKRFKRMLFIRAKHSLWIFRVTPFIKLQNNS